ncbi:PREDICTED: basic proline-rich protein-like [Pseudopodoces humilis]|uniref:basic proline-rich protein-like n=1 Tax=Pseudopodoces humilis TaxID=181119 RepID=UPI000395913F|nr:PREDICTED: basic proline-rich protein-like [Pseudopodoces humilis]
MLPSASAPREGGWEAGDREAPPPLDLCQDFSLPAPSSPPGSAPPRPLAPRPAAGSRPRPAAVPGPPPHPAPSPGAQERLPAGVPGFALLWPRSKVRKTPGFPLREPESDDFLFTLLYEPLSRFPPGSQTPKQQLPPPLHFQGEAVTTAAPAARPREEPAGDGTTQARTLRRPRPVGHSGDSRRQGSWFHAPGGPARPSPRPRERGDCTNSSPSPPPRRQPPAGRAGTAGQRAGQRLSALEPRSPRRHLPFSRAAPDPHSAEPRAVCAASPGRQPRPAPLPGRGRASPASERWARRSPARAARPSGTGPRPVRARTRRWRHTSPPAGSCSFAHL